MCPFNTVRVLTKTRKQTPKMVVGGVTAARALRKWWGVGETVTSSGEPSVCGCKKWKETMLNYNHVVLQSVI